MRRLWTWLKEAYGMDAHDTKHPRLQGHGFTYAALILCIILGVLVAKTLGAF